MVGPIDADQADDSCREGQGQWGRGVSERPAFLGAMVFHELSATFPAHPSLKNAAACLPRRSPSSFWLLCWPHRPLSHSHIWHFFSEAHTPPMATCYPEDQVQVPSSGTEGLSLSSLSHSRPPRLTSHISSSKQPSCILPQIEPSTLLLGYSSPCPSL